MKFDYKLSINGVEQEHFTTIDIESITSNITSENKKPMLRAVARHLQSLGIITTETNLLFVRDETGEVFMAIVLCWTDGTLAIVT